MRIANQGRRRRRNFDITPQGEAALRRWLASDEAMPFELRDIGLVKLFFADALDRADALALLQAVIERSRERVAALNRIEPEARRSRYPSSGADLELGHRLPQSDHRPVCQVREGVWRREETLSRWHDYTKIARSPPTPATRPSFLTVIDIFPRSLRLCPLPCR